MTSNKMENRIKGGGGALSRKNLVPAKRDKSVNVELTKKL